MKLALIGAGQRGRIYADYAAQSGRAEICAVADPNGEHLAAAAAEYSLPAERQFFDCSEFFAQGKLADGLIIASMDRNHFEQTMTALELGYDILLEKPVSPSLRECLQIEEKARKLGRRITVCHVLRYTDFFGTIKKTLDSGELGKIISIQHNENIGNFHMAHSFVRGNWRREDMTSPLLLQKSCHDMDLLAWLANSRAEEIVSFGSLRYFRPESAPEGSAERCCDCALGESCRFHAMRCYRPMLGGWPATVVTEANTEEELREVLKTSPYGRCVFHCDNTVCDNQVALIRFENGVTVSFNLSAFTNKMCRTLKIMCENGEIRADDSKNLVEVTHFAANQSEEYDQRVLHPTVIHAGHGGGDARIMEDFLRQLEGEESDSRSSITQSIESHVMAFAAERSRLEGRSVKLRELWEQE